MKRLFLAATCSLLAAFATAADRVDFYREIVRRNGWATEFSDRALASVAQDADLSAKCRQQAREDLSPSRVEGAYIESLRRFLSPSEAKLFAEFLRTSVGAKFGARQFDAVLSDEERATYQEFWRSSAAKAFERFGTTGLPVLQEALLRKVALIGVKCAV